MKNSEYYNQLCELFAGLGMTIVKASFDQGSEGGVLDLECESEEAAESFHWVTSHLMTHPIGLSSELGENIIQYKIPSDVAALRNDINTLKDLELVEEILEEDDDDDIDSIMSLILYFLDEDEQEELLQDELYEDFSIEDDLDVALEDFFKTLAISDSASARDDSEMNPLKEFGVPPQLYNLYKRNLENFHEVLLIEDVDHDYSLYKFLEIFLNQRFLEGMDSSSPIEEGWEQKSFALILARAQAQKVCYSLEEGYEPTKKEIEILLHHLYNYLTA